MRCIFYHYNNFGMLVLDYSGRETRITQYYVYYPLKQAINKFRKDHNLQYKHIKVLSLD